MKLLFFIPTLGNGGAESHMARLANGLADSGHDVTICVARAGGSYESWLRSNIKLVALTGIKSSSTLSLLMSLVPLMKTLRRSKPDITLSFLNNSAAILYLAWRFMGKLSKLVIGIQNNFSAEITSSSALHRHTFLRLARLAFRDADHMVALSEGVKQNLLSEHLRGIRTPACITTINNICLDDVTEGLMTASLPIERPAGNLLLAVGRLGPQKDYPVLLSAIKQLKERADFTLWILGVGPLEQELKAYVESNGLSDTVVFLGFQKNPFPFFSAADVFVLSSQWEGFGNVIVEAMSVGTAVVSTDCDYGPSEITQEGEFGLLSPVGDAEALAKHLETLLADTDLRESLAHRGKLRAQSFQQKIITEQYASTLAKVLA